MYEKDVGGLHSTPVAEILHCGHRRRQITIAQKRSADFGWSMIWASRRMCGAVSSSTNALAHILPVQLFCPRRTMLSIVRSTSADLTLQRPGLHGPTAVAMPMQRNACDAVVEGDIGARHHPRCMVSCRCWLLAPRSYREGMPSQHATDDCDVCRELVSIYSQRYS